MRPDRRKRARLWAGIGGAAAIALLVGGVVGSFIGLDSGHHSDIAAAQWSPDQRAVNLAAIPVLRTEAADMRRLAGKATNPVITALLEQQALHEDRTADAIPNYQPGDAKFWGATVNFSNAVNALCNAVAPR
jgi:hypothetical protein